MECHSTLVDNSDSKDNDSDDNILQLLDGLFDNFDANESKSSWDTGKGAVIFTNKILFSYTSLMEGFIFGSRKIPSGSGKINRRKNRPWCPASPAN